MFEPVANKGEGDFLGNQYYRNFILKSDIKIKRVANKGDVACWQRWYNDDDDDNKQLLYTG